MLLRIVDDLTSTKTLDAQLLAVSDSGLSINEGVHPSVTLDNLLHFLPNITKTPVAYSAGTTYGKYEDSRLFTDIVVDSDIIYQSLVASNTGNTPASSPTEWLVTTIEALRLKVFIHSVKQKALSDVNLVRRQVDNQYLYNVVEQGVAATTPSPAYIGYMIEPKGSDYTRITINQMALQATTASSQNLYVINQGQLITTLTLNPNLEGRLEFEEIAYSIPANKGAWIFAIDSQDVLTNGSYVDSLKYDGFVPQAVTGAGASPQAALYTRGGGGNGLSFNITVHFDPSVYIANNLKNFGKFLRAAFELQTLVMYRFNPNNRSNLQERTQWSAEALRDEVLVLSGDTSANKYDKARTEAISMLEKTNDKEINNNADDFIELTLAPH
jgi:hypothetical protein